MEKVKLLLERLKALWSKLTAPTDEPNYCELAECQCDVMGQMELALAELKIHGGCDLCANCNLDVDPYCDDDTCWHQEHWTWHGFPGGIK